MTEVLETFDSEGKIRRMNQLRTRLRERKLYKENELRLRKLQKQMHFNSIRDECCQRSVHKEGSQNILCPSDFAAAASQASHWGMWWCFCASDDSEACRVPANLACNLCWMSSRLRLIVPVLHYCQKLRRSDKGLQAVCRAADLYNSPPHRWNPQHKLPISSER